MRAAHMAHVSIAAVSRARADMATTAIDGPGTVGALLRGHLPFYEEPVAVAQALTRFSGRMTRNPARIANSARDQEAQVEDDYERAVSDIAAIDSIAKLDAVLTAVRVWFAGDPRRVQLERPYSIDGGAS
jgi:hypothetical protein